MKSLLNSVKSAVVGLGFLGMSTMINSPPINAEEILVESKRNNYKTEISADTSSELTKQNNLEESKKKKSSTFFGFGTYNLGQVTWLPCTPLENEYSPGSAYLISAKPYDKSYGFGLGIEYEVLSNIELFFEGSFNTWDKLIAKKDKYGVSSWIFEQTNYNDARVGPFQMDTYYYMDTTSLKAGAKFMISKGKIQPWVGAGYGIYSWKATIGNKKEEKKYGQTSGLTGSLSTLAGIDLVFNDFVVRAFGDFGAPVVNLKIENLFQTGWTFENTGEHIVAPYKLGIAIGIKN